MGNISKNVSESGAKGFEIPLILIVILINEL